jgi:hypothetical protein
MRHCFQATPLFYCGIGLSFPSLLPLLDIGDHFFMRNRIDYQLARSRYGDDYAHYTPDIAYHILEHDMLKHYERASKANSEIEKVGVCFPYTWLANEQDNSVFYNQLVEFLSDLAEKYKVYIIPFDVSSNKKNSDLLLVDKLKGSLRQYTSSGEQRIFYCTSTNWTIDTMINYFKSLDMVVASRYHSVIMSILTETPFVSLYSTRKIANMKDELHPELRHLLMELPTNDKYVPTTLNGKSVLNKIAYIASNYNTIRQQLRDSKFDLHRQLVNTTQHLLKLVNSTTLQKVRNAPPQYISPEQRHTLVSQTVSNVLRAFGKFNVRNIQRVYNGVPLVNIISSKGNTSTGLQKAIAEEILWSITEDPYAPYYYGLFEQAHKNPLVPQLEWLIDDYYMKFMYKRCNAGQFKIVNKNFQELHRSGWQFIVDNIVTSLNQSGVVDVDNQDVIIDTYVDKTFHWNKDFYKSKSLIPYTKPWIGFIHHTYSAYNNAYNCENLFKDEAFQTSLKTCKALIVMSNHLKGQLEESLNTLYTDPLQPLTNRIRVEVLCHPSEETPIKFTLDKFNKNDNKQVVQIGNWLRNVFGIYQLSLPHDAIVRMKSVLRNKNCDNYFLPNGFFNDLFAKMKLTDRVTENTHDICRISFENMHLKGMYQCIMDMEKSVNVIEYLDNTCYDELLASNIVFINLIDASAVNTVVECILRNTPMLVNPISPVVELLGVDYPYYYTSSYEASNLLADAVKLQAAHEYLANMDKTRFSIATFMNEMTEVLKRNANMLG